MKTKAEILERIAERQQEVDEEALSGGADGEDRNLALQSIVELQWVLGE